MKKILFLIVLFAIFSCKNNSDSKEKAADSTTVVKDEIKKDAENQKGLEIVTNNDCATCHRVDEKIQGPSYRDIANKYAAMPDTVIDHLANKIIHGGSGVWGEIAMAPHPALNETDAKEVVKYILSLKNK
ncbi:MAG: c-type cytochrome [Bacteroidota bacterium]|nr:c-type cytochrome [Bacteroidota bacterium]